MEVKVVEYKNNKSDRVLKIFLRIIDILLSGAVIGLIFMLFFPPLKSILAGIGVYYLYQLIVDDIKGR